MNNKRTVVVWRDSDRENVVEFVASQDGAQVDLDNAAHLFGYIDYADMAESEGWGVSEGLNIEWRESPEN